MFGSFKNLCPIFMFGGTDELFYESFKHLEILCLNDGNSIHFYEYKNMFHCWMFYPIDEANRANEKLISIICDVK
jgi:acetyl esterase/lipase